MQRTSDLETPNTTLTLLTLFGLTPVATKTIALLIVFLPISYFLIRLQYPCTTSKSLLKTITRAKETFDKCVLTDSFVEGEFDPYKRRLQRVTVRAFEIASTGRAPSNPNLALVWDRTIRIVECYREARSLIFDLGTCLLKTNRTRAKLELEKWNAAPVGREHV